MKKNLPSGASRYFIAILPPSPVFEEIQELKNYFKERYQSGAALNSPPHITLLKPFFWKENDEDLLFSSLNDFVATSRPIIIELSNFSSFAPKVIFIDVVENERLNKLQLTLNQFCKSKLKLLEAEYKDLPFHPHLTLAFRDLSKQMFAQAWLEFKERNFKSSFTFDEISLLKHNGKIWERYKDFHF